MLSAAGGTARHMNRIHLPLLVLIALVSAACSIADSGTSPAPTPSPQAEADGPMFFIDRGDNGLFKFDPSATNSGEMVAVEIGTIGCGTTAANPPYSLAIDRAGDAIVALENGAMIRVDTDTAACIDSGALPIGAPYLSIRFVSNGEVETLYGIDENGILKVLSVDAPPSTIGSLSEDSSGWLPDIAGTDDGRLFAFFIGESHIREVSLDDGQLLGAPMQVRGGGWDVVAYTAGYAGGSVYTFYTFLDMPVYKTIVNKVNLETGVAVTLSENFGHWVVGAGAQLTR